MNIDFKSMDGRIKKLYSALWGDFDFNSINTEIENTRNLKDSKPSRNSYCFSGEMDKHGELLMEIFDINEKEKELEELFKEKFTMAVSGSGQELLKIGTLHSSSLCALLHFYNVTEDNPLILDRLETNKTTRKIKFTRSVFEYKSPVINTNHPSNMDVVLTGQDIESGEDIVLFLESKFAEYYTSASTKCKGISQKYLNNKYGSDLYKDNVLSELGLKRNNYDAKNFELVSVSEPFYIGGIKQMISHYIGIRNVLDKKYYKDPGNISKQKEVEDVIEKGNGGEGAIVILGEIVFDRFIGDLELKPGLKCGEIYSQKYEILADEIGKMIKNEKRFEILKKELGYSLFLTNPHVIEDRIRQFYREK